VVVDDVHTLDVDPGSGATIVADLCADNSESIAGGAYRYIACTEVLEHTAAPWAAVVELARLLAPGGLLYLSVPYNFRIHGPLPDAWRINEHGLRHLARHAGLELVELSALETPGRPLHPVHYTAVLAKDPS
jgi:SAM-dependent methyltransferase